MAALSERHSGPHEERVRGPRHQSPKDVKRRIEAHGDRAQKEAQSLGEGQEAVELFHRMGKINEDMLIDAASAKAAGRANLSVVI